MIDWDYETRLIDRIAARQLLRQIEPRKRRMLCASYVRQDTFKEIAQAEGISTGRVGQLVSASMARLLWLARRSQPLPAPVARAAPPRRRAPPPAPSPGWQPYGGWQPFDPVAFLDHMRRLIELRAGAERQVFVRERAALDQLLHNEAVAAAAIKAVVAKPPTSLLPPPKQLPLPLPKAKKPLPPIPHYFGPVIWQPKQPTVQHVEPWFDLTKPLTVEHGTRIARYALQYFVAARRPYASGVQHVGAKMERIVCDRTADAIAGALKRFADRLPVVRLSAIPVAEPGAAMACDAVGLRVASGDDNGWSVIITFTWDDA